MTYTLTTDQLADVRADVAARNIWAITLSGSPTGGTFTLTYGAQTTSAIDYNATETAVMTALQALSTIGAGGCIVTGQGGHSDAGGPYTVIIARDDGTAITANGASLTGGSSPSVSVVASPEFSDTELNRNYTRAEGDYNLAVVISLRQLLAKRSMMPVYSIGADGLNKQKSFDNTKDLLKIWEDIAGVQGGELEAGVMDLGLDFDDTLIDTFGTLT